MAHSHSLLSCAPFSSGICSRALSSGGCSVNRSLKVAVNALAEPSSRCSSCSLRAVASLSILPHSSAVLDGLKKQAKRGQ
ncbi:hypothetical protein BD311DRAFT_758771 [Dichomitus squalens]|uniref:Uncharacterized protein n=1 Tax=Dichomitus squalens TaxID=114155 RepID=A0A4Q9ML09_9APHY|nr:hypothetical protein BD311DRAFT_758771 [Dichomitus squalens]